jgi:hypothetical protein
MQLAKHIENDSTWRAAHVEHVAIRDAIAAHDPARARAAMGAHLEMSHRRFSRDFGEAPFTQSERVGKDTPTVATPQSANRVGPSKTRKEPHKAAVC